MNKQDKQRLQKKWFELNQPTGKELGYPDCCIKQFGNDAPEILATRNPTKDDVKRYKAGCIDAKFTGFIPCIEHANQIMSGKIILSDLIKNRSEDMPPFPLA